ncbi:hypothetical protein ACKWTF_013492 [Chironomus riparius]
MSYEFRNVKVNLQIINKITVNCFCCPQEHRKEKENFFLYFRTRMNDVLSNKFVFNKLVFVFFFKEKNLFEIEGRNFVYHLAASNVVCGLKLSDLICSFI